MVCGHKAMGFVMRNTLELLLCSTIGAYCVWRCYSVLPLAIAEAHALVAAMLGRVRELDAIVEPDAD